MPCNEGHTVRSCILLWTASGKDGKKQTKKPGKVTMILARTYLVSVAFG